MERPTPLFDPPGDSPGGQTAPQTAAVLSAAESELRFRDMSELSSDWYWEQDADFRFTYFSGALLQKTGVRQSAHLGRRRWDTPALNLSDADWAQHRAVLERHEAFHDFMICRPGADGEARWSSISGRPVFDAQGRFTGYRGIGRDVTAWRVREDTLRRFRAAVDATADGIHIVDMETMRFIDVNETACRYLGYSREEFLALSIPDIAPDADLARLAVLYRRLFSGDDSEQSAEIVHRHRDGRRIPIEIRRRGVSIGGRQLVVNVVRDITANKRTEAMIRHHALQQSLIAGFGQQALASGELPTLMARAASLICEGLGVVFSRVIRRADDNERVLMLEAGEGWQPGWVGAPLADDGGRLRRTLAAGAPVFFDDPQRAAASPMLAAHALHSGIEITITGSAGAYGLLGAYARGEHRFTQENADFLQTLANTLATAIDRTRAERRLAYLAQFDALTGLPNRTLFLDRFAQTLTLAQRNDWLTGVIFVDLDRFKAVNDTLGHAAGDRLLIQVAQRLQGCVRSGDTVGRLSGDEFAMLLSSLARADDAALVAHKVVAALSQPFKLAGQEVNVSASLGIAIHPLDGHDPDGLLKNADTAMYRAKARGRNTYQFYLPQMNERAVERLQVETQLRGALERGELVLHYQPKLSADGAQLTGFEARLHWRHPRRGLLAPADFLPTLEDTGLIVPVGEWMLRSACVQLVRWRDAGVPLRPVAVNLSLRQFQQRELAATLARILGDSGIGGEWLELELSEAMLTHAPDEAARTLAAVRALGVRLSVDDFGTGCASLAQLKRFPLDALKIGAALVAGLPAGVEDAAVVCALIQLGHGLRLRVIGDGVTGEAQRAFLRQHGCDELQGDHVVPALPAEEATRLLRERAAP